MNISVNTENGCVALTLKGRLDTQTAENFRNEVQKIDFDNISHCTLDLSELEYVSSAGLREFITIRKRVKSNDRAIVINPNTIVESVLKTTGIYDFFTIKYTACECGDDFIHLSYKDLLSKKVIDTPNSVFLTGDEDYTWEEIDRCSHIIALDLYKSGVRKGSHVAIFGANSINWVLCFFAIQKLGAIAALINYNLGENEITELSKIGDITHICCGDTSASFEYDTFKENITDNPESMYEFAYDIRSSVDFKSRMCEYNFNGTYFENPIEADDVAVMIFTSGSTGKPKGVLLSAYNILNAAYAHMESINQNSSDRACLILPLFHIFGLLSGLCTGMLANSRVVFPKNLRTDTILSCIKNHKCTIMHSVPTMMLAIVNNKTFSAEAVNSLRSTILAGASVTEAQLLMLKDKFPKNHFSISYGLSEMAPITVTDYDDTIEHLTKTVGKPVKNIEIKIIDTDTEEICPVGKSGAIMVRGYNLMTCYYKLAIDDQSFDNDGWLYTGDLGFLDDEGYLHLSGRLKELIIRGGENIIPNEVASAISEHSDIADVKVIGIPDLFYGEIVSAAIVMKDGKSFDEAHTSEFLSKRIAKFKIPSFYAVYDNFPTLSNGKVDAVNLKKELTKKYNEGKVV